MFSFAGRCRQHGDPRYDCGFSNADWGIEKFRIPEFEFQNETLGGAPESRTAGRGQTKGPLPPQAVQGFSFATACPVLDTGSPGK